LDIQELKKIFLFTELSENELDTIRSFSHVKKFNKGEIIFFDTEPYLGFYGLLEGIVKLYKISKEGREQIIHIVYPYNTFAEVPVFENYEKVLTNKATYPVNAMSISDDTEAILISAKQFLSFLENNSGLCFKFLSNLSKRLRFQTEHLESISLQDITKRLSVYLIHEFESKNPYLSLKGKSNNSNCINLKISKYDLASYLGTIIETLSRTFKKLQNENVIEVHGKRIILKDLIKLKHYAS
jgi:CRP/FNR family transcriptional regulator